MRNSSVGISLRPNLAPISRCAKWCNRFSRRFSSARGRLECGAFGTSQRSLSAVHVAEREYSRMADGRHFVSDDEKERRAVATIDAQHHARCHVITGSLFFLSFFLSLLAKLPHSDGPRKIRALLKGERGSDGQMSPPSRSSQPARGDSPKARGKLRRPPQEPRDANYSLRSLQTR